MEKEQKQSRYPWHEAPEWVNYAVTNKNGIKIWFECKPIVEKDEWLQEQDGRWDFIFTSNADFEESLESRPSNLSLTQ